METPLGDPPPDENKTPPGRRAALPFANPSYSPYWACPPETHSFKAASREASSGPSTEGLPLRVKNPRLIGFAPKEDFVDPGPVNALGFDLSLHVRRVAPKSGTRIALSPVKTTRSSNRVADLRKHNRTRAEVRRFPQLLCGFVGLLRRRTSSNNLGGAVANRRFVGKPHSGKALEHTCGDELCDDFKSFHGADSAPSGNALGESHHRANYARFYAS